MTDAPASGRLTEARAVESTIWALVQGVAWLRRV